MLNLYASIFVRICIGSQGFVYRDDPETGHSYFIQSLITVIYLNAMSEQ